MMAKVISEYRVIGPPGTGKTTWICNQAERALSARLVKTRQASDCVDARDLRDVLIASLTRAAANELRGRGLAINPQSVGTLHAHAFRALGCPKLCVDAKDLVEFNAVCQSPYRLSGRGSESPDRVGSNGGSAEFSGDRLLERYLLLRARCVERNGWPIDVAGFAAEYESWKMAAGRMDFSDVIHEALKCIPTAPGCPAVMFVDEVQDNDRAELRLIRKWGEQCEMVVLVGDPAQNLYEWRGSDPEAFYEHDIPVENTRLLSQSHRVPAAVHSAAMEMICRCRTNREPAEYRPRDAEGVCRRTHVSPCSKFSLDDMIGALVKSVDEGRDEGKTTMMLAACEYQLRPLLALLRDRGVPFHNPFAADRAVFNPLHPARGVGVAERILAYLRPCEKTHGERARMWTISEFLLWTDVLDCRDFLRRGAKQEIAGLAGIDEGNRPLDVNLLRDWVLPARLEELSLLSPDFFQMRLAESRRKTAEFAMRVLKKNGAQGLARRPSLVVGTIHSVKGAEADTVFLCPDLSRHGHEQLNSRDPDPVYRQFYVGMTRARERLFLCEPASRMALEW